MSRITRTARFCGVLALWLSIAVPDDGRAGVKLQGSYEYLVPNANPNFAYSARFNFEAIIAGCSWKISYEDLGASTDADLLNVRATASCDGTNIYLVQYQSDSAIKRAWGNRYDSVKNELTTVNAIIFPGNYPPPEEFTLQTIWFALSANCVLGSPVGRAKPLHFADLAMFYDHPEYHIGYFRTTDQYNPGTHRITFTNDGSFLNRDQSNGKLSRLQYAPPYHKGFVEGIGVWRGVTNVGDVLVPSEFEYTGFVPKYAHRPNTAKRRDSPTFETKLSFKCIVTNVEAASIGELPVQLPNSRVFVSDRRLANEGWAKITYIATNVWTPLEDVIKMAQTRPRSSFESEVMQQIKASAPITKSGWVKYSIAFLLILPLGFWALGAISHRKQKQRKVLQ